jgi:putative DNA methylase
LVKGRKGKGTTIQTDDGEYDPDIDITITRGDGKCPNCGNVIEGNYIDNKLLEKDFDYTLYAIAYKLCSGKLEFRLPTQLDLESIKKAKSVLEGYFNSDLYKDKILVVTIVVLGIGIKFLTIVSF